MESLPNLLSWALPFAGIALTLTLLLAIVRRLGNGPDRARRSQTLVLQLGLILAAIIALPLLLPLGHELRGQLLSLLGLLLSAVLGLASTTFVANAMAGFMQRSATRFEPGDFISVGELFGRVTERALFHTELQTEDRDLVTLPNLYLVTNPVKVVRASGTLVNAEVSLGYDVFHGDIERCLLGAAESVGLEDGFVQVLALGDFSVSYRVSGFLREVRRLVTVRSALRVAMLDALHAAGIEIVSPNFMNQRPLDPERPVLPDGVGARPARSRRDDVEGLMFDKADIAARLSNLLKQRDELRETVKELESSAAKDPETSSGELELRRRELNFIEQVLDSLNRQQPD